MRSAVRVVASGRGESAGGGVRFDERARQAALQHAQRVIADGGSLKRASRELGIAYGALRRWRPVRVRPLVRAGEVAEADARGRIVVVLRSGARIEGLDLAGVAELVRRLS